MQLPACLTGHCCGVNWFCRTAGPCRSAKPRPAVFTKQLKVPNGPGVLRQCGQGGDSNIAIRVICELSQHVGRCTRLATAIRTLQYRSAARVANTSTGVFRFRATRTRTCQLLSAARIVNAATGVFGFHATALRTVRLSSRTNAVNTSWQLVELNNVNTILHV